MPRSSSPAFSLSVEPFNGRSFRRDLVGSDADVTVLKEIAEDEFRGRNLQASVAGGQDVDGHWFRTRTVALFRIGKMIAVFDGHEWR